jgi:uncharacterized surface protein with fasciclin (FAS1) repeats
MRRVILITLFLSLGLLGLVPSLAQDATSEATTEPTQSDNQAYIRVAHFSPETAGVDIFLDDQATDFKGVEYKTITKWIAVPSGAHTLKFAAPGGTPDDASMSPFDSDLQPGTWTTYVVTGSAENGTFAVEPVQENFDEMRPGVSSFTFVNAVEGDTHVDIIRNDVTYVPDLFPPGTEDVNWSSIVDDTDTFTFRAVDTANPDSVLAEVADTKFNEDEVYLIAAVGTADPNDEFDTELVVDSTNMAEAEMLEGMLEPPGTIVQALQADEHLAPLADAIDRAGLTETLSGKGPFTLFVPADFVMDNIPQDILNDATKLKDFLEYHVVEGDLRSQDVFKAGTLTTLNGEQLTIEERGENGFVNDAQIIDVNIPATNGTIHMINQALIPPSLVASNS